ncbi:MAG: ComEC/Rec2 family competence protein [Muribaculum sp.]|nr:ComEC/Rec2 family competence protein [Muribaculum sp.]
MDTRPHIIVLPLALTAGILLNQQFGGWILPLFLISASLILYLTLHLYGNTPIRAYKVSHLHLIWLAALFVGVGSATSQWYRPGEIPSTDSNAQVEAHIEDLRRFTGGDRMTATVNSISYPGGVTLRPRNLKILIKSDDKGFNPGDIVVFPHNISPLVDNPNFLNNGYADLMRNKGFAGQISISSSSLQKISSKATLRSRASSLRDKLEIEIENSGLSRNASSFLITMLLADKDYMESERRSLYSDTGTAHLIAVSGMHVGIITIIIFSLLFPLNFLGLYKWRYAATIPVIWAYVYFTGLGPSAARAAIMATFAFIAIILERPRPAFSSLLWAVFFILLFNPFAIFDIGFQMSVACVASLIAFANPLNVIDRRTHPRLYKLNGAVIATLSVTFATWMLSAYYFEKIPLMFLPSNIMALPAMPCFVVIAILHILIMITIPHHSDITALILNKLHDGFETLLQFLSADGATTLSISPGWISVVLWSAALVLTAIAIHIHKYRKISILGCAILSVLSLVILPFHKKSMESSGIIIRDTYDCVTLASYIDKNEETIVFPSRSLSRIRRHGMEIINVDIPDATGLVSTPDIIIINGRYKGRLAQLMKPNYVGSGGIPLHRGPLLVFHTSLRRKREDKLIKEADSLHYAYHSLRRSGPWRAIR